MESIFVHPALKEFEIGSAPWFDAQRRMIKSKPLVKRCYDLWYKKLLDDAAAVPSQYQDKAIVELGSGSSYIKDLCPAVVTSDVVAGVADQVIDGRALPFGDQTVKAIFLTHVFHHIPDIQQFLQEADRVLVPGGVISIIDCTHTPFARFFFSRVHPEPYDDTSPDWTFPQRNSMLDSNQALSWIVFFRDRAVFEARFPGFRIEGPTYLPWFTYLLSGGVNLRSMIPPNLACIVAPADSWLKPLDRVFALHWHISIRKKSG